MTSPRTQGALLGDEALADLSRAELEAHARGLRDQVAQAQRKLRGIQEIGQILASERDLDRVLGEIMKRTTVLMNADRATLFILSDDQQTLWSRTTHGGAIRTIELRVGQGIAGWVARYKRQVNVKDAYRDPRFDREVDRSSGYQTRSVLCQPLQDTQGNTIGVIQVLNKRDGYFTTADEGLLRAIGGQAAVCILNARLYVDVVTKNLDLLDTQLKLQDRTKEIELLFRVERAAAMAMTRDEALHGVLACVLDEYPCDAAAVLLLDPRAQTLTTERVAGESCEWLTDARIPFEGTILGEVLATSETRSLRFSERPLFDQLGLAPPDGFTLNNAICLPVHHNETLGVLLLLNRRSDPRGFDDREISILGVIANRVALSVVLSRAMEEERKAERLAAIGKTLSSVVHDLKTPLTIITGYARALAREDDPAIRQRHRESIKKQIDSITAMIQELLAFSRGDSHSLIRKVWVKDFVDEVSELLHEEFAGSGVALTVETPYRGAVRMDEQKMKRAIFNLARNAREALSERGGGSFRITVDERDGQVCFSFSDDGPGIPREMEGRLFDSFATHGKKNGTGLGLAIVKKIVDEHRGRLDVRSEPGLGTTFTIELAAA